MQFDFATAGHIIFGVGAFQEIRRYAPRLGKRVLVLVGGSVGRAAMLLAILEDQGLYHRVFSIDKEPTISLIEEGLIAAREAQCDLVIGYGGGSVIDAGKAISALFTNPGEALDYLEVIGKGQPLAMPPLPYIAIPTTAGTGAEVTRNAVLTSPEHGVKVSLRSARMLPNLAIVDPALTLSLPPEVTAYTGMDALAQCIEPFVSPYANPLTDTFCREGIRRAARSLLTAFEEGDNISAREDMALAALLGGLALANAKLGAVHGFAGPLGGLAPQAPHGAICGRLLPFVIDANVAALSEREPGNPGLARFEELAQILTGNPKASVLEGCAWTRQLSEQLEIPPLSAFGVRQGDFPVLVEKARLASSMKGNPVQLTRMELTGILMNAL